MRVTLLVFLALSAWPQVPAGWTPELSMRVARVDEVVPSPDGQFVAYTQTRADIEGEGSDWLTQILVARSDGTHRIALTRPEKNSGSPAISPDGRFVYFLSPWSDKPNLWRVPVKGGPPERLTAWHGELARYRVSPDGKWLAFAGVEPAADFEKARKEKRDWWVVDENPRNHNLWVIPTEPEAGGKRRVRRLTSLRRHVTNFDWSPDSLSIAFEHQPNPSEDTWPQSDVSEVDVRSGAVKSVAATGAAEGEPRYSLDGQFLAYMRTPDPASWAGQEHIVLVPRRGGSPRVVASTFDEGLSLPGLIPRKAMGEILGWASDSSRLLFTGEKETHYLMYAVFVDGMTKVVYAPAHGVARAAALNATGTWVGFSREGLDEPPEAFVLNLAGGAPVRVSAANAGFPRVPRGQTRSIRWKSPDGLEIEGLLTLPVGYKAGKKYPLALVIHGGPMGYFNEEFLDRYGVYPWATFAARGFAVLRANIRGSGGYGSKFRLANYNDWGGKDYEDLMAGVDHMIAIGVADPDRLAVMGWSYGGFMTSWIITHTRRFKAAVVGAGVTNLWSFTGTTDILSFLPDYFSGESWDKLATYLDHSPMAHVKGVTTPTLILHSDADVRVPISQGYELYNALKRQGVETQMVVYPRMPHLPSEPKFQLDIMRRYLEWIESHIR